MGGGIAIWLTTAILLILGVLVIEFGGDWLPNSLARHIGGAQSRVGILIEMLTLATAIMIMGLIDDLKDLDWRLRLGIQVACATALAVSGIRVTLFWPFTYPILGGTVTVLWIVALTNSFNMLDNMDGLAASVGLIAATLFCGAQIAVGDLFPPAVLLVVIGALGGFLVHNHFPARLYMGDAGSNFLGFLLGTMTVVGTFYKTGILALQRTRSAAGHGGAAVRHDLGRADPVEGGTEPVQGRSPALFASAGCPWLDAAAGGLDD